MLQFPCSGHFLLLVGKRGQSTVICCLDQALGNEIWQENFFHSSVNYLCLWGLDHRPVLATILLKPFRETKKFQFEKDGWDGKDI